MATGTVQFQSATLATPLAGLSVMADAVNDTDHGAGTTQYVKVMDGRTGGTIKQAVTANGAEVDVTRVQGTIQALGSIQGVGTFQVLGSVQTVGTSQVLGTVQTHGTSQVLGTVQAHGTNQALGTFQPLAGSVHLAAGSVNAQGVIAHGAAIAGNPVLFGAFGSSGTQAAVADGQLTRLWSDLNGRIQVRGTIDSIGTVQVLGSVQTVGTSQVLGTVQTHGTSQVLGTVQAHGTAQVLGTTQPLAGSVHLAAGSVNAQGVIAHGAAIAGNPVLWGGFGSSGTQAAVSDGQLTRAWFDLNGRLQVRGTIDSIGTIQVLGSVQTVGTSQVLGTTQPLAGSVHLAAGSVNAQGVIAHGAAIAGNPVLWGGFGSSGTQAAVSDGQLTRAWLDLNGRLQINASQIGGQSPQLDSTNKVGISAYGKSSAAGDTALGLTPAGRVLIAGAGGVSDGIGNACVITTSADASTPLAVVSYWNNGSTNDRARANMEVTLLSSSARTTTTNSSDQTNYNGHGLVLIVDVTSAGTGSITPSIQIKDNISGNYKTIWTAIVALTANGTYAYVLYPGSADAAGWTEVVQAVITRTWRLAMVHNNANSITYSTSATVFSN